MSDIDKCLAYTQELEQLRFVNKQLNARIARIEHYLDVAKDCFIEDDDTIKEYESVLNESPQQSLAAIQADAVDYAVKVLPKNFIRKDKKEWTIDCDVLKEHAQQLRQQGKEKQ